MMSRRQILVAAGLGLIPSAVLGQARRIPRVGVLHAGSSKEPLAVQREPFERGLRDLGWIPGSTIIIDYRYAEGDRARLAPLADELTRSGVDVIVARADAAINAARKATSTIPIVMAAYVGDPAADGVVKNASRPGGNVTGIGNFVDLDPKRLELLKEAFPRIRRVGVLLNPLLDAGKWPDRMRGLNEAASVLKLQLQFFEVHRPEQISSTFAAIGKARVDALLVRGDPEVLDAHRADIAAQAARLRVPAMYWWRFFVEAGGLMSYGNSIPGFHNRSATFVDRILKGAKASELAIEQPTRFELMVNLKTAEALGVRLSREFLQRADGVIS
jgi:putative ABC transport system substrate-binding protein